MLCDLQDQLWVREELLLEHVLFLLRVVFPNWAVEFLLFPHITPLLSLFKDHVNARPRFLRLVFQDVIHNGLFS